MEKTEKERKKKLSFRSILTRGVIENSKKRAKKFKKLKKIIVASFQAKIDWKRLRKRENKDYRSVPLRSYPMCNRKFQKKIAKNFKKLKK